MSLQIGIIAMFLFACESTPKQSGKAASESIFSDNRDQSNYSSISINGNIWMLENSEKDSFYVEPT